MTIEDAIASFAALGTAGKTEFLAGFAYELTVLARDSYEPGREGLTHPARVRKLNEIQHRVTSFLWALLRNDPRRYPDEILVRIIHEPMGDAVLEAQVAGSFFRSLSLIGAPA